jgi:WD40 repeat protein/predicted deacylase
MATPNSPRLPATSPARRARKLRVRRLVAVLLAALVPIILLAFVLTRGGGQPRGGALTPMPSISSSVTATAPAISEATAQPSASATISNTGQATIAQATSTPNVQEPDPTQTQTSVTVPTSAAQLPDNPTLVLLHELNQHSSAVWSVAFSPQGNLLATGSADKTIVLWEVSTGAITATLEGHTDKVESLAFSPDGNTVASGSADGTVRVWQVPEGKQALVIPPAGNPAPGAGDKLAGVKSVAFSPDGTKLVAGYAKGAVLVWRVSDGMLLDTLAGATNTEDATSVDFARDGQKIGAGFFDGKVRIWNIDATDIVTETKVPALTLDGNAGNYVSSVAFSPGSDMIAAGLQNGMSRLWDTSSGELIAELDEDVGVVNSLAFRPMGDALVTGNSNGNVRLWRISRELDRAGTGELLSPSAFDKGGVLSVAFDSTGIFVATGSDYGLVKLWKIASQSEVTPVATLPAGTPTATKTTGPDTTGGGAVPEEAIIVGSSVNGLSIKGVRLGNGPRVVVIVGAIHGTEANSADVVNKLIPRFKELGKDFPPGVSLYLIPVLNPDGFAAGTRRNANGVDLNRNWDTPNWVADTSDKNGTIENGGGTKPFSEPESLALSRWLLARRGESSSRLVLVSYHSAANVVLPGLKSVEGTLVPDAEAKRIGQQFAATTGYGYRDVWDAYPVSGELTDWCADNNMPSITVELPTGENLGPANLTKHYQAILDIIKP